MTRKEKSWNWEKKAGRLFLWKAMYTIVALVLVGIAWLLRPIFNVKFLSVFNTVGSILIVWAGTTFLALAVLDLLATVSNYFQNLLRKITRIKWAKIDILIFLICLILIIVIPLL